MTIRDISIVVVYSWETIENQTKRKKSDIKFLYLFIPKESSIVFDTCLRILVFHCW